jgi:hypothetical protein
MATRQSNGNLGIALVTTAPPGGDAIGKKRLAKVEKRLRGRRLELRLEHIRHCSPVRPAQEFENCIKFRLRRKTYEVIEVTLDLAH